MKTDLLRFLRYATLSVRSGIVKDTDDGVIGCDDSDVDASLSLVEKERRERFREFGRSCRFPKAWGCWRRVCRRP